MEISLTQKIAEFETQKGKANEIFKSGINFSCVFCKKDDYCGC